MIRRVPGRFVLVASVGVLVGVCAGCSVFGPVGDLFSRGYENTVSYFNAFYNAKRLFQEAEDEIQSANLAARGKTTSAAQATTIPQSARQKLTTVIEKSSHILSLYPESALVDDALFLIGKSYYYQADYLKAERKFTELLAQYPNSSLRSEAQLWLTRTMDRLKKDVDALKVGQLLGAEAERQKKGDIAGEVYALMGDIEGSRSRLSESIEFYKKATEVSDDDFLKASTQAKIGDALFSLQRYEEAASAYVKAIDYDYDIYLEQYCKLQAAIAYRNVKRYDSALTLINGLLDDIRFKEYFSSITHEYARTLMESGRTRDAINEYRYIDSTYARTEIGAKAAFDLGYLLETDSGDFRGAQEAYARASGFGGTTFGNLAGRRQQALAQYFQLHSKLAILDSLLNVPGPGAQEDSTRESPSSSNGTAPVALNHEVAKDSVSVHSDSLRVTGKDSLKPQPPNKDSLRTVYSETAYQLGEVFYSELELPDSAYRWLEKSISLHVDSSTAPRILFVLADIAQRNRTQVHGDSDKLYRRLVEEYPRSTYAEEARKILGLQSDSTGQLDPAEKMYAQAETMIEGGQYKGAVRALKDVITKYPASKYAAKSQYTIGWLFEYRLSQPDSALTVYKNLVERHASSPYAAAVKGRLGAETKPAGADTVKAPQPLSQQEQKETTRDIEKKLEVEKSDSTARRRGSIKKIQD